MIFDFKKQENKSWENAIESYDLTKNEEGTLLKVSVDTIEKYVPFMNETFPKALIKLKSNAEK